MLRASATARLLLIGQSDEFLQEGLLRFPQADTHRFPDSPFYSSRPSDREAVRNEATRHALEMLISGLPDMLD